MLGGILRMGLLLRECTIKSASNQMKSFQKFSIQKKGVAVPIFQRSGATVASNGIKIATNEGVPRVGKKKNYILQVLIIYQPIITFCKLLFPMNTEANLNFQLDGGSEALLEWHLVQ